jgi:hypothetical protein
MSRIMGWVGHVARETKMHRNYVENPERKRPLGRRMCRRDDNINMDVKYGMRVWAESNWLRLGSSGDLLWRQQWIKRCHKRWEIDLTC